MQHVLACLVAGAATFLFLFALRPVAYRIGLLDVPGGRKLHGSAVPLVGGVAMYGGFLVGVAVLTDLAVSWLAVAGAAGLLVALGFADDLVELPFGLRLFAQVVALWLIAYSGAARLDTLGNLLGPWELTLGAWAIPFTVFAGVGVINAFNMVDGLDGLASGVGVVVFSVSAALALSGGRVTDLHVALLMLAVVTVFFLINFRVGGALWGRVFMGDAGSLFIGLVIACLLMRLSQGPAAVIEPVTAIWIFALPLIDTLSLMVRRVRHGRSPFAADRSHLHHVLQRAGFSDRQVVYLMVGASVLLAAAGVVMQWAGVPEFVRFYLFVLLFLAYLTAMFRAWRLEKALRRWREAQVA